MKSHLAYKFRLYPSPNQIRELGSQLETLRHVYNAALAYWRDLYATEKRSPKGNELYKVFSTLRNLQIADQKAGGCGPHWLTRIAAVPLRDTLKRCEVAFKNFFRRVKQKSTKVGYPRFKSYGRLTSIPFDNYGSGCVVRDMISGRPHAANLALNKWGYRLDVFGVGRIRICAHRELKGKIKTACVQREGDGQWYVVLVTEQDANSVTPSASPPVGVDVGLEHFLTTSDGQHETNPRHLKSKLKELRRMQRAASRKSERAKKEKRKFRDSKNLQRDFRRVAKLHARVRRLRREHHYQVANRLVGRYGTICVESLNVANMVRNGKLSRAIADAGWSGFVTILKHKAVKAGVGVVEVDPSGTSQTCPQCGGEVRKKLKDRKHCCPHCGYTTHRDHAAAQVILARGLVVTGTGKSPVQQNVAVAPRAGRTIPSRSRCAVQRSP